MFSSEWPALCCSVLFLKRVVAVGKASADLSSHQSCPIKSPAGAVERPPQRTSATTLFPWRSFCTSVTDEFVPHVAILWSHRQEIASCKPISISPQKWEIRSMGWCNTQATGLPTVCPYIQLFWRTMSTIPPFGNLHRREYLPPAWTWLCWYIPLGSLVH